MSDVAPTQPARLQIERATIREVTYALEGSGAARGRRSRTSLVLELVGTVIDTPRVGDPSPVLTSSRTRAVSGRGEAAPLPDMSPDTLEDARAALEAFVALLPIEVGLAVPALSACLDSSPSARFAIETALLEALARSWSSTVGTLLADAARSIELERCRNMSGPRTVSDTSNRLEAPGRERPLVITYVITGRNYVRNYERASETGPSAGNCVSDYVRQIEVDTIHADRLDADLRTPVADDLPVAVVVDNPDEARRAVDRGARCLKIKVGPGADVERVRAIALAAGDAPAAPQGITFRLDANGSWPRERVIEQLTELAGLGLPIEFVEEPCSGAVELLATDRTPAIEASARESLGHAELPLPIALDESLARLSTEQLDVALHSPSLGALILKPTLLGGFASCLELAARAREAGKSVVVTHTLEGPIGFAACCELAHVVGGGPHGLAPYRAVDAGHTVCRQRALVATPTLDTVTTIRAAFDERRPLALLHHALTETELERRRALVEEANLDDAAFVLFTSGSTGDARGVVLSHAAIEAAAAANAVHLGWHADDRWLVALSTAHAGGLAAVMRCHLAGKPIELLEGDWDRDRAAALLERCTLASLVPTQLASFLDDPAWRPPARLRAVLLGGAAASPALLAQAAARHVPFLCTYGMTETFGQIATAHAVCAGDPGASLAPLPGVTIEAGTREAPARIAVRGGMLASRYLDGAPIAPRFETSDVGFVENGAVHVVGRADEVIITGGENVHPATVEAVLTATPGVTAAVAFGIADERWGQIVGAAVVGRVDEEALTRWGAALPAFARPRELAVVTALPMLPTGKLDRRAAARLPREPVRYRG